jgi:hypothetical protein
VAQCIHHEWDERRPQQPIRATPVQHGGFIEAPLKSDSSFRTKTVAEIVQASASMMKQAHQLRRRSCGSLPASCSDW